jgi:hypothetical protein
VREQVELLKHPPGAHTQLPLLFAFLGILRRATALNRNSVYSDATGISDLELIEATQECALAAPARADENDSFPALLFVIDPVQDAIGVVRFD